MNPIYNCQKAYQNFRDAILVLFFQATRRLARATLAMPRYFPALGAPRVRAKLALEAVRAGMFVFSPGGGRVDLARESFDALELIVFFSHF